MVAKPNAWRYVQSVHKWWQKRRRKRLYAIRAYTKRELLRAYTKRNVEIRPVSPQWWRKRRRKRLYAIRAYTKRELLRAYTKRNVEIRPVSPPVVAKTP